MDPSLLKVETVSLAAPWCAGLVFMVIGAFLLLVRGRVPAEKVPRPTRLSLEERFSELGFRGAAGRWEGRSWGRPMRIVLLDDPQAVPPVVQELSTPVEGAGQLQVVIGEGEQSGRAPPQHKIGDPIFDRWFDVTGTPEELSLLDASVRRALCNAGRESRPRLDRGVLSVNAPGDADIDARLPLLVAVASAFETAAKNASAKRIFRMAISDPEPGVRMRFLDFLAAGPLEGSALEELVRKSSEDADPIVRAHAASLFADPRQLLALARTDDAPYQVRRKAGRALLDKGSPSDRLEAAVALAQGHVKLHPVALELALSAVTAGLSAEPVLTMLTESPNGEVVREATARLRSSARRSRSPADSDRRRTPLQILPTAGGGDQDQTMVRPMSPLRTPPSPRRRKP